ncbi:MULTISPECIES: BLUF domain-containing protein [Stenotrophomonas]|uniref:BLUF domain-containing protein n=1 Tax=Stenotrophomonas TaxID=40323 RepID=UPI000872CB5A|nr:BLUF domain-containing protein [Stenotrophomonas sp. BIIR7]OEZ02585.1 hypothetical protein BIY45_00280 [Stenotrophomonas sp. BIIR7]
MPVHAIAYVSQLVPGLGRDEIDELVRDAAAHNSMAGVTGVLLCDGAVFLQYLEGPADGVASAYRRIRNATSHFEVMELGRAMTGARRFPFWSMHWIPVDQSDLAEATRAEWAALVQSHHPASQRATGVDKLRQLVAPHLN